MKSKEKIYRIFALISPKAYRVFIEKQISYSGYKTNSQEYLGTVNFLSLLAFAFFLIYSLNKKSLVILSIGIGIVALIQLFFYFVLYFAIEERKKRVEDALPDFLYLVAANLKAGMPPYEALKHSSMEEFGPLKEEIHKAAAKGYSSSFIDALLDINKRINSEILERALKLLTTAIKSGGHMANLLEELANDIAENKALKRELSTGTKTYAIFIIFIVVFGAPLLMAVSIHFVDAVQSIQSRNTGTNQFGLGFFTGEMQITSDFLVKVSIVLLVLTSISASMLLGAIKEGRMKYGLKYSPLLIIGSVSIFYFVRFFAAA